MVSVKEMAEKAAQTFAPRVVDGQQYSDFTEYCKAYRKARLSPGKDGQPKRPSFTLAPITAEGQEDASCDIRAMVLGEVPVDESGTPRDIVAHLTIDGQEHLLVWEGLLPSGKASVPGAKRQAVQSVLAQSSVLAPAVVAEILAGILGRKAVADFPAGQGLEAQRAWLAQLTVDGLLAK